MPDLPHDVVLQPTGAPRTAPVPEYHDRAHEDKVLLVLTLIIGAVVGLVVVAFIVLTENLGSRLYPAGASAWRRVLIPVFGALFTGFLLYRYFPNARGSGIPQTKAALFLREGYISFRTVLGKFGVCSVSLASGIALGREGPSVHVGAGIASTLGRKLGLSPASVKALVPTGASAALAAAFNTPISAVLFSLEEVMGDLHAPVLGSIVLSSATSWIVLHLILGDEPLFHVPAYQLVHPIEFIFYAALGVIGGIVSVTFVKLLLWQRRFFLRAAQAAKSAQWILPAIGGLTVGMLGWFFPEVLGVGYAFVGRALNGQMVVGAMALLVLLKIVATSTCYASGNAGGIFGPSLFIGAMMGGAVGGTAHLLLPDYTGSVGAYALVGMGTAFAGIVRVPLTSVIMVFEITRDYSIVVPLMIANLISYFISSRLQKEPIYEALQHQDGVQLPSGARARERLLMVGHAYRPEAQVLSASEPISQVAASVDRDRGAWPVMDEGGFRGMVSIEQLDTAMAGNRGDSTLGELVPPAQPEVLGSAAALRVYPDDPLDVAMSWLADRRVRVLPVLSRANPRDLKGTVSLEDVLQAYSMARPGQEVPAGEPARAAKSAMPLLAGVLAVLVGVAVLGGFLSYFYRAERTKRADIAYTAGNALLGADRVPEAIEQYRNALSISHRVEHRLALALALIKAERMDEAAIYLREVLRERPESGPANLGMAEVAASTGRIDEAVAYYRRAAAGAWDLPADTALQRQTARMLLDHRAAREAAGVFEALIRRGPPKAADYEGLGEAHFQLGDFRGAATAFRRAVELDPGSKSAAAGAELSDRVVALDPTQRGLLSSDRFSRSQEILSGTLAQFEACAGPKQTPEIDEAIVHAKAELARKRRPPSLSDAADANLALAGKLWTRRLAVCSPPAAADPLAAVMSRLTVQGTHPPPM